MLHAIQRGQGPELTMPRLTLAERVEAQIRSRMPHGVRDLSATEDPLHHGGITLHGTAHSYYCKQLAQEAAKHTAGVIQVSNDIEVV